MKKNKNVTRQHRTIKCFINYFFVIILTMSIVSVSSSVVSGGKRNPGKNVTTDTTTDTSTTQGGRNGVIITVTIDGLDDNEEALVSFERIGEDAFYEEFMTTNHTITYNSSLGGTCIVKAHDVSGYSVTGVNPQTVPLTILKGDFTKHLVFVYEKPTNPIAIESLTVSPSEIDFMVVGSSLQLATATLPENASQNVELTFVPDCFIDIDNLMISAISAGSGTLSVTARTIDGESNAKDEFGNDVVVELTFDIYEIIGGNEDYLYSTLYPGVTCVVGDYIELPSTVPVILDKDDDNNYDAPVTWEGASFDNEGNPHIVYTTSGEKELIGHLFDGTDGTPVTLSISVENSDYIDVDSVELSTNLLSLFVKTDNLDIDTYEPLSFTYLPIDASEDSLDNLNIVYDESMVELIQLTNTTFKLIGLKTGDTELRVEKWNGDILDRCFISISLNPMLTDNVYIKAVTYDKDKSIYDITAYEAVDQFLTKDDVFILGYGLPDLPEDDNPNDNVVPGYHVSVDAKSGKNSNLGSGLVTAADFIIIDPDENDSTDNDVICFNLNAIVGFDNTTSFSASYFVSVSLDGTYPHGDDENGDALTWVDNFKITSPVPTGYITVVVSEPEESELEEIFYSHYPVLNTNGEKDYLGYEVILARIVSENEDGSEELVDYLTDSSYEEPTADELEADFENGIYFNPLDKYTDEVKMVGYITEDGSIAWENPREKLKIGGYILLINLPASYKSNLNLVNPASDDGSLLKEVHILRNKTVEIEIIIVPK